jgi:hypothetical protein
MPTASIFASRTLVACRYAQAACGAACSIQVTVDEHALTISQEKEAMTVDGSSRSL